jgi:ribosomal protein S18 acetylase RimI-like enzyme
MKYLKYFEAMEFTSHFAGLITQYNGEKFTLSGGQRVVGGLNVGEKSYHRLKYIIYSNELFQQTKDEKQSEIGTIEIGRENDGTIAVLIDITIKPKFRKSGYGRQLINEIVDTTKDGLHVYDIKKSAIKFWQKIGAELTDTKFKTINGFIPKKEA